MSRVLDVYLDGAALGTVRMSDAGSVSFIYDEDYRRSAEPTPLSMSMPLARAEHKNRVVLAYLQGLLPDNAQALSSMATTYGVSAASPFALLEHMGRDVAGALQLVPEGTPAPDAIDSHVAVEVVDEQQIGALLENAIEEYRTGKPMERREGRFSLAGAQPKIALHSLGDGRWGVPRGSTPTTHIFKPAAEELSRVDVVEQITMEAARQLGLGTAESRLEEFAGVRTLVSTRYDRVEVHGQWRRRHQEDLCQALGVPPTKKYQRIDGGPGLAAVAGLLDSVPVLRDRRAAAVAFFSGFVFNAIVAGTDAHAKNYSLILEGEGVRLAPLYDLASYAPYWGGDKPIELAMNVNGKYRLDSISSEDLVRAGMKLRLGRSEATEIVLRLRDGAAGAFVRARDLFAGQGKEAEDMADRVVTEVAQLPLVGNT